MCGRNSLFHAADMLESTFEAAMAIDRYEPRYNIAPTQAHPVITNEQPDRFVELTWGFLPSWADTHGSGLINARAETARTKAAFSEAWERRPCLVPSSGFYEWQASNGKNKRPFRIHRTDDEPFAMAGLWTDHAVDGRGTFTILTTEPNELVGSIHDRMPVVLRAGRERGWLEGDADLRQKFCEPYPDDDLEAYPISTRVNDPSNDEPSIIVPDETEQTGLGEFA